MSPFSCHSQWLCVSRLSVLPGGGGTPCWRHDRTNQMHLGTVTCHSWMGSCFQTSLLQPATHILQAILMFLESPPKNNHIIQISWTCGPLNSCQNQIHSPLRGAGGIAETKRHHVKLRERDTLSLDKFLDESALGRSHWSCLERSTALWCRQLPWAAPLHAGFYFCLHF